MAAQPQPQPQASASTQHAEDGSRTTVPTSSGFPSRSMKQLGLFFAGAGFMLVSTMVTRRAVTKKQIAAFPKFYQPSHRPAPKETKPEGSLIALEALYLATLNVISFTIMATGGVAWAFDFASIEDVRQRARAAIHGPGGHTDEAAEREIEEWISRSLSKFGKSGDAGQPSDSSNPANPANPASKGPSEHNKRSGSQ